MKPGLQHLCALPILPEHLRWRVLARLNRSAYRRYRVHGHDIFLNVSESPMMLARVLERYEPEKHAFIRGFLKSGMTFVDIGANKGDFALLAAGILGDRGRVLAIEPEPENCRWIARSVAANGFGSVELLQAAVSDRTGEATLHLSDRSGWHTLIAGHADRDRRRIMVRTLTLDDLVAEVPKIDLIKIDVEGAEESVVAGAGRTLARHRPTVLLDLHPSLGVDTEAIAASFERMGYAMHAMHDSHRPLPAVPAEDTEVLLVPRRA